MMPKRSGFDVCQEVRKKDKHTPILFLTARNAEIDKVHGFNLGGDDYLTKPFGIHEFIARVSALLRRTLDEIKQAEEEVFEMAGYSVNRSLLTIKDIKTGEEKHLSPREYEMLLLFAANPLVVFSREKIIETIWDCRFGETTRTVDVFISKVRRLLGSRDGCIETVRAGGYRYNPSFGA
jgi:two-component system alkaline phosphatase synthesis response regulator PhoP